MLEEVSRIAAEAGRIALGRCGTAFRQWEKVPGHPVCDIDLEVDAVLREHLTALDPVAGARVPADQLPQMDGDLIAVAKPNSIALRIAMVAAGEADLVATLRWGFEWDIAAAALIAAEAGATVTGVLGQPFAFNTHSGEAFGVLVATPGIHAAAVERLRERAEAAV